MAKGLKTGGREAGTPNKITQHIREILTPLIEREITNLPALLNELDTKDRLKTIIALMPYISPKMQNIALELNEREFQPIIYIDHNIVENLNNLNPEEKETYLKLLEKCKGKEGNSVEI